MRLLVGYEICKLSIGLNLSLGPTKRRTQKLVNERNHMKTMPTRAPTILGAMLLALACASLASGPEPASAQKDKTFKGTLAAVEANEKTVSVAAALGFKRTFNVAEDCRISLEDRREAALSDLRPGQRVEVGYRNTQGVRVAMYICQHNVILTGRIKAIDEPKRAVAVKTGLRTRHLTVADDCSVVLHNEKPGALNDLKVGNIVKIRYESPNGSAIARRIEQPSETYVGTIEAIDAKAKTVKAKQLLSEKKFNLASGCQIVVHGKAGGKLSDLRIGDRVTFSYENENGVLVANRLGLETSQPPTEGAQTADTYRP